jgi:hypothetical protein
MGAPFITVSFLQATKKATLAIVLTFLTQFLPVPMFSSILYYTDSSKNVDWLMLMYPLNDIFSFIVCAFFMAFAVISLSKAVPPRKKETISTPLI